MDELRFFLFGAPRIERDRGHLNLSRRKSIALLAYLVVTAQTHNRDTLATLFWPEYDQSNARANLRREISRLKQALGDEVLAIEREQVRINHQSKIWIDTQEFNTKIQQVEKHSQTEHASLGQALCRTCLEALTAAVRIYRGDFMTGFSLPDSPGFDEWQFFNTESLRQSLANVLQQLIQWHSQLGEYEQGIEFARRWLALDPLHEPAHRQLMQLYAWSGQQAAAIRQYQECVRILDEELGLDPEEETSSLYEAIRTRKLTAPEVVDESRMVPGHAREAEREKPYVLEGLLASGGHGEMYRGRDLETGHRLTAPNNLPAQATPFIGREKELAQIEELLLNDPACRLVTLVGPGGAGKTRLALQAAVNSIQSFHEGVYIVPLASLTSSENIGELVAEQIRFRYREAADVKQQLLDYLRDRQMLLVLDNFEHLLAGSGLVLEILRSAPKIKLLVTSRERLNLSDETILMLGGMAYPNLEAGVQLKTDLSRYEAVKLLVQSARKVRPGFELQPQDYETAARICRLVEGMPLAIVLASGWLEMLSLEEVADEISRSLDFLESQAQDLPERQRCLRAVFNSSWILLNEQDRSVLARLAIFRGSFTRQAAQSVSGAFLSTLLSLIHKSWLHRDEEGRYQIHELLRQYAMEMLTANPADWQAVKERYCDYYAGMLHKQVGVMRGPEHAQAFTAIAVEFDNIRIAWQWLLAKGEYEKLVYRMLPALFLYCEVREKAFEFLEMIEGALRDLNAADQAAANPRLATILLTAKASFFRHGFPIRFAALDMVSPAYEETIQQAWSWVGSPEALYEMGFWGAQLAFVYGRAIDRQEGSRALARLVQAYRGKNERWEMAFSLELLGCLSLLISLFSVEKALPLSEADQHLTEALSIFQQLGDEREGGYTLRWLAHTHFRQQKWDQAAANWLDSQAKLKGVGDWAVAADINWDLGGLYLQLGDFKTASRYFHAMSQVYSEMGYKRLAAYALSKESFEAVRYDEIEHARETRIKSLELSRQDQDVFGEAWSTWEMGEIYRVEGDLTAARQWYEKARVLFEQFHENSGIIFYHRGLGDIAYQNGDYSEAQKQFRESLERAQKTGFEWGATYAQAGLGRAAVGAGQYKSAHQDLTGALQLARSTGDSGLALVVLAGFARLFAAIGKPERAAELAFLVTGQYTAWNETKSQMAALIKNIGGLSREFLVTGEENGRTANVWEVAERLLQEAYNLDTTIIEAVGL